MTLNFQLLLLLLFLINRKFAIDRIEVHVNACSRVSKKRKVFDITKMRVKGTEAESFVLKKKPTLEIEVIKIKNSQLL
jgi:hypothetical protein